MFHSGDIGQVVRKWQIRFSGAKSQSIDVFLVRLEDCKVRRPPPLPGATLLPEMAYKPPPNADAQRKPKGDARESNVAAAASDENPEYENLEELLRRV